MCGCLLYRAARSQSSPCCKIAARLVGFGRAARNTSSGVPCGQNRRAAQRFQQHRMVRARSRTKPRDFRRDFTRAKVSSAAPRFPHSPAVIYLPRRRRALSWLSSASSTAGFAAQRGQCALLFIARKGTGSAPIAAESAFARCCDGFGLNVDEFGPIVGNKTC